MHTPPLEDRMVPAGLAAIGLVLAIVSVFVYASVRVQLHATLDEALDRNLNLVASLESIDEPAEIAATLQSYGVTAQVKTPAGDMYESVPSVTLAGNPSPLVARGDLGDHRSAVMVYADGTTVEVFVSEDGVNAILIRLLVTIALASIGALALGALLMQRIADYTVEPLNAFIATAKRTARGERGARLNPDDPSSAIGQMAAAYDAMLDALESAIAEGNEARHHTRVFVDDAAHQLRTPLAAIRATIEAIVYEPDAAVVDRLMANLIQEVSRANNLVTSLLTLARVEEHEPNERFSTDLDAMCDDEAERARFFSPELTINVTVDEAASGPWLLDPKGTWEVLANLVDNARRHAESTIDIDLRLIPDEAAATLALSVRDDGHGVPAGAEEAIFDRFVSLDGDRGSGLGLAIARKVAQSQGGNLVYVDRRFLLTVPAKRPAESTPAADALSDLPAQPSTR